MPTIDYSNQHAFFDELDFNLGFASFAATTPTTYSWLTSEGNTVTFVGTGINVDANNVPTSGIITSIEVTLSDSTAWRRIWSSPTLPQLTYLSQT